MRRIRSLLVLLAAIGGMAFAQYNGTYYSGIDSNAASFVNDLHNKISTGTSHVSYSQYDETVLANYEARDTTNGRKVVTCVYSGLNYIYTPPFAWIGGAGVNSDSGFSREHTWCHNWMPTNPADSPERDEYADQHHLFPVNQNHVNGIRSDHPLGVVVNVQSAYLSAKIGTNASGQTVYEPRAAHKGDAARALLYMSLRYNGIAGKSWTFRALNDTILPSKGEAPIDLNMLIQWHKQDPPDAWELGRNTYIESVQGNRNPFVDHPSWVDLIDFYTLTKKAVTYAVEPTNHPTAFAVASVGDSTMTLTWTGSTGAQLPSGYLLLGSSANSFTSPTDGVVLADDTTLSDGTIQINLASDASTRRLYGLLSGTTYYFRLYAFNGTGAQRNYKTDGTIPSASGATTGLSTEPTNYPTNFAVGTITSSSIQVTWTGSTGAQLPTGYLLMGSTVNAFTAPTDGTTATDDSTLGNGYAQINLSSSATSWTFSGLTAATTYYFRIYPYAGSGSQCNYKTAGSPPSQYGLTTGSAPSGPRTPAVAVNEYCNDAATSAEWVELLVIQNNLDMRGMNLRDYSSSGSAQAASVFSQNALWSSVPSGTFIVVLGSGNTTAEDLDPADKKIVVSISNATYFSTTNSFNISGSNDAVEILTSGNTHIHSLSHGGTTKVGLIASLPAPTAYVTTTTSLATAMVVRCINTSADSDFGLDAKAEKSTTLTQGAANDASQATYISTSLPVELRGFTASTSGGRVSLRWTTASEVHNAGFTVQRRPSGADGSWTDIGFVRGAGTSNDVRSYSYEDLPERSGSYCYRLRQTDDDGTEAFSEEQCVSLALSGGVGLSAHPNPFNPASVITYRITEPGHVVLAVYDLAGRRVAMLADEDRAPGSYRIIWNGERQPSGTYFVRLQQGSRAEVVKLLLMR